VSPNNEVADEMAKSKKGKGVPVGGSGGRGGQDLGGNPPDPKPAKVKYGPTDPRPGQETGTPAPAKPKAVNPPKKRW